MTPEGKIEKHLKKEVEASGGKVRKLKWIGKNGAPDRLIWFPGLKSAAGAVAAPAMAFIELKAPGKKPTKVQEIEHDALRADGFLVFVIDSPGGVDSVVAELRKARAPEWKKLTPTKLGKSADEIDVKSPPNLPPVAKQSDNSDLA